MKIIDTIKQLVGLSPTVLQTDLAELRQSCVSPDQLARARTDAAAFNEVQHHARLGQIPSQRIKAYLWLFKVADIEQLTGFDRQEVEGAGFVHIPECVARLNEKFYALDQPIRLRLAQLLREFRAEYSVKLQNETERFSGELLSLLKLYGAESALEQTAYMQTLRLEAQMHTPPVPEGTSHVPDALKPFIPDL